MISFKNLKSGFSFIEMMVALTLLAIFGSSIFLVQSDIFSKIFKTHQAADTNQDVIQELIKLKTKIEQTVLQKKEIDAIALHETKKNPNRKIDLTLKNIPENSTLYKTFGKDIKIVQSSITYENNYKVTWHTFTYIPKIVEKPKEQPKADTQTPNSNPANPGIPAKGFIA
jgi:prepilin-type N-terminal cleavage/methylation domain-containing protein